MLYLMYIYDTLGWPALKRAVEVCDHNFRLKKYCKLPKRGLSIVLSAPASRQFKKK